MSSSGRRRRGKPLWKRRRVWIVLLAVVSAIALTLWLVGRLGDYRPPAE